MEPVYSSAVDVLIDALKRLGRETYLHALVYFGEHKCHRNTLSENFSAVVTKQMEAYHDEALTGYLLIYSNKFINLVEGSESTIMQHLNSVAKMMEKTELQIGPNVQVVIELNHIKKRMFNKFHVELATPPTLATQFTMTSSVQEVYKHLNNFCDKYFKILEVIRKMMFSFPKLSGSTPNLDSPGNKASFMLPESELIAFLLKTQHLHLQSIQSIVYGHKYPPYFEQYEDIIWPLQRSNLPYYVFMDQLIDTEEPVEEEEEEEEEEKGKEGIEGEENKEENETGV